ncbi:MAG: 50S ribosomal protein L9 [Acidobacteria bacterium]|nr:50S ribosomal protein L9 [Acidobacteriota bacterium]
MEVILREDIQELGSKGDIVTVKDGYARNYLLPQKLALLATTGTRKQVVEMKAAAARKDASQKSAAETLAEQMSAVELTFTVKAGESDQLFGSVTSMDIAEALEAKGFSIDRRKVELAEPIRTLGEYTVSVRIHREVAASVKLQVVREEGEQEGQAGQEEQKEKE